MKSVLKIYFALTAKGIIFGDAYQPKFLKLTAAAQTLAKDSESEYFARKAAAKSETSLNGIEEKKGNQAMQDSKKSSLLQCKTPKTKATDFQTAAFLFYFLPDSHK